MDVSIKSNPIVSSLAITAGLIFFIFTVATLEDMLPAEKRNEYIGIFIKEKNKEHEKRSISNQWCKAPSALRVNGILCDQQIERSKEETHASMN